MSVPYPIAPDYNRSDAIRASVLPTGVSEPIRMDKALAAGSQGAAMGQAFEKQRQEEASAAQFEQVLNQGYAAMSQVYSGLSPEEKQYVGDPQYYAKNKDDQVNWYKMLAVVKTQGQMAQATLAGDADKALGLGIQSGAIDGKTAAGEASRRNLNTQVKDFANNFDPVKTIPDDGTGLVPGSMPQPVSTNVLPDAGIASPTLATVAPDPKQVSRVQDRLQSFEKDIQTAAKGAKVDASLLKAVLAQESTGKPDAKSSKGATGLMQLMPDTATAMGVTDITNPSQNIAGGAKYLSQMLDEFNGDRQKALAAYNAGPGRVNQAVRLADKSGRPGKWMDFLPPETRDYVPKVLGYHGAMGGEMASGSRTQQVRKDEADAALEMLKQNPEMATSEAGKAYLQALKSSKTSKDDLAALRLALLQQSRDRNFTEKQRQDQQKYVQKLTGEITSKNIPQLMEGMDTLHKALQAQGLGEDPSNPDSYAKVDVKGFGPANKVLVGFLQSPEGEELRRSFQNAFNIEGYTFSGKVINADEMTRLKQALGASSLQSVGAFKNGVSQFFRRNRDLINSVFAGYDPDIQDVVKNRSGLSKYQGFLNLSGQASATPSQGSGANLNDQAGAAAQGAMQKTGDAAAAAVRKWIRDPKTGKLRPE